MRDYTPKIPKTELVHGAYYRGRCRNATVARWHGPEQQFYHWRTKFGTTFLETIRHPEDEAHFDVFVVEAAIPAPEKTIPFPTPADGAARAGASAPTDAQMLPATRRGLARACLLGGALGDALGAPIEFETHAAIVERYGPDGVSGFVDGAWPAGSITDDTQMTLFTGEGLIRAGRLSPTASHTATLTIGCHALLRWLITQGETTPAIPAAPAGLLLPVKALWARRAPGLTCLSALRARRDVGAGAAVNDSKGCGGVMRVAPAGLWVAARWPRVGTDEAFVLGRDLAALTHGHPTGQLAAGAFAQIIAELCLGTTLPRAIAQARAALVLRRAAAEETVAALDRAVAAAAAGPASVTRLETLGQGWTAEEALSIALYSALATDTFEAGVRLAVNHGGDSDSTGAIAGQLLGLLHGEAGLPAPWLARLELRELIVRVAEDLWDVAGEPARLTDEDYPTC